MLARIILFISIALFVVVTLYGSAQSQFSLVAAPQRRSLLKSNDKVLLEDCAGEADRVLEDTQEAIEDVEKECKKEDNKKKKEKCREAAKCGFLAILHKEFRKEFNLKDDIWEEAGKKGCKEDDSDDLAKDAEKKAKEEAEKLVEKLSDEISKKMAKNCVCRQQLFGDLAAKFEDDIDMIKCDKGGDDCLKRADDFLEDLEDAIDDANDECKDEYRKCKDKADKSKEKEECEEEREECEEAAPCFLIQKLRKELGKELDETAENFFEDRKKECDDKPEKQLQGDGEKILKKAAKELVEKMTDKFDKEDLELCNCVQDALSEIGEAFGDQFKFYECEGHEHGDDEDEDADEDEEEEDEEEEEEMEEEEAEPTDEEMLEEVANECGAYEDLVVEVYERHLNKLFDDCNNKDEDCEAQTTCLFWSAFRNRFDSGSLFDLECDDGEDNDVADKGDVRDAGEEFAEDANESLTKLWKKSEAEDNNVDGAECACIEAAFAKSDTDGALKLDGC